MSQFTTDNLESILAVCALLVSIISVILTLVTIRSSRKHNRLSVRPICIVHPLDYEDRTCVSIQNKGTGPLVVTEMVFKNFKTNITHKHLIDHMPQLPENFLWHNFTKALYPVLSPGESKVLVEFRGNMEDIEFIKLRNIIRKELSQIDVDIKYKSIYDERKPFYINHRLSWFSRNI